MEKLKKRNVFASIITAVCLLAVSLAGSVLVRADGMKVVTLGADLTQEQKDTMLRYFKVDKNEVEILTITNQDEREHLSSYVPLEQIGTRTVSCSYVKPTNSGGIKVRTTNLNWVTCNMIATTLSTSGISNCEVVAACPFEVSGTGALTGIIMAYETASGEKLDEEKKELATEELVVTGDLAENVGQNDATNVINESKMEIIDSGVHSSDEIYNIVINIAQRNGVTLDEEQLDRIVSLLTEIAQQNYDYEAMRETLENVENNLTPQEDSSDTTPEEVPDDEPEITPTEEPLVQDDSIIDDLDEDILGDDVYTESTEDPVPDDVTPEDLLNTDDLSEENKELFEQAEQFCEGEFKDNPNSEQYEIKLQGPASAVVLSIEDGSKVTQLVLETYISILREGGESYTPAGSDPYITPELNMLQKDLFEAFELDTEDEEIDAAEGIWANCTVEDRLAFYDDTMTFFENLYGETTAVSEETPAEEMTETPEEITPDPAEEETPDDQDWAWLETEPEDTQELVVDIPVQEDQPQQDPVQEEQIPEEVPEDENVIPDETTPERTEPLEEVVIPGENPAEPSENPEGEPEDPAETPQSPEEELIEATLNTDDLPPEDQELFEAAKDYCAGEFEENTESEQYAVKQEGPAAEAVLSEEDGKELTEQVLLAFIEVLRDDGETYVPADDDVYLDPELNMLEDSLVEIFEQPDPANEEEEPAEDGVSGSFWTDYSEENRKALFDDTMAFFEKLYGEETLVVEEPAEE